MSIRRLTLAGLAALGALYAAAPAAGAVPLPTATTEAASEVTFDAATLQGAVLPGGSEAASDTRWCFEYGTIASSEYNLGSVPLLPGDAGMGTSGVPVSVRVSGLEPASTYRYRLVAVNALGTGLGSTACGTEGGQEADGAEGLLTTPVSIPAPLAVTGAASGVSQNAARIAGTVYPRGIPTTYEFQLGVDTSYGVQVFGAAGEGSEPVPASLSIEYLQPGTTYHYRLVAIGQGGTSYGADATFTTPVFSTATLSAPAVTPLVATPVVAFPADAQVIARVGSKAVARKARKRKGRGKAAAKRRWVAGKAGRAVGGHRAHTRVKKKGGGR